MRHRIVYAFLLLIKAFARTFYRFDWRWVGAVPAKPWTKDFKLVAILNHTSLFEFLFAGGVPNRFLRRMARHGVVPIAAKTIERPIIGKFWRLVAGNVVSITRERDQTWEAVLRALETPGSMTIILPEGRMKRANGLDQYGRPLKVRGGIAELLAAIPEGELLLAYSEGLHHIQAPGEGLPRLFQPLRMRLETLDIPTYRAALQDGSERPEAFRQAMIDDLMARRDRYCDPQATIAGERPDREFR